MATNKLNELEVLDMQDRRTMRRVARVFDAASDRPASVDVDKSRRAEISQERKEMLERHAAMGKQLQEIGRYALAELQQKVKAGELKISAAEARKLIEAGERMQKRASDQGRKLRRNKNDAIVNEARDRDNKDDSAAETVN